MSEPAGIPEAPKNKMPKQDKLMPYDNENLNKAFKNDKISKSEMPNPSVLIENSYAVSPEVIAPIETNKSMQQSQPVLSTKFQKNFIFKRVKNRMSKDNKFFKGRVYSAVRRSTNMPNLEVPAVPQKVISK